MIDLLDSLSHKCILSKSSVLSLVDDYTLFCYYAEQDLVLNQAILSPLRLTKADTLPSFNIYSSSSGAIKYHDHGTGEGGDVFQFIKILYGLDGIKEVLQKINIDFGLGFDGMPESFQANKVNFLKAGVSLNKIPILDVVNYPEFSETGRKYWNDYHIDQSILTEYNVGEVRAIILEDRSIVKPSGLAFSYRIGFKFKIYQPFDREFKFRNNFPREYVEGYYQLMQRTKKSEILFITKSMKDVMVFRKLGIDAVSPKGENTSIPDFIIQNLLSLYPYVFILFDNDPAGLKGSARYERFNVPIKFIPLSTNLKDTSDYIKVHGPEKTKLMLKQLVTS